MNNSFGTYSLNMKRHSYSSLLDDRTPAYYNPFVDLMKVEGPLTLSRSELLFRLELPHRQISFTYISCMMRAFASLMYDQVVALGMQPHDKKIPVPLNKDDFHIWDIEQIVQMILSSTRNIHEAYALLWATCDLDINSHCPGASTFLEKVTLDYADKISFSDFRPFYQRMKYALRRVGFDNFSRMVTFSLNPPFLYPVGKAKRVSGTRFYQIIEQDSWEEKAEACSEQLHRNLFSPLKRMEALLSVIEHCPCLFLSELAPHEFLNLVTSRVLGWWNKEEIGKIDCSFDAPGCFLIRARDLYNPESHSLPWTCLIWKPLCREWYQHRIEEERLRHSPELHRASSVEERQWQAPTLLDTQEGLLWRGELSPGHRELLMLESVATQLLNGYGLDCPFYSDCADVCVQDADCPIRVLLGGIWRNTKPDGANRWEKPQCLR